MAVPDQPLGPTTQRPDAGHRDVRRAWISLALLPVSFVAAVLLGDWLLSLQGYDSGDDSISFPAALVAGGPAVLVLIAPAVATFVFGLRARKEGDPAGTKAVVTGGVAAVGLVVLNVLALFVGR